MGGEPVRGVSPNVAAIEDAFEAHWRLFGLYPGASLHDDDGILWYRSEIPHLPYNAVIRTRLAEGSDARPTIERIAAAFRDHSLPFMWVHRPSDQPADLPSRLAHSGLDLVEQAIGMDLDLADWRPPPIATPATIIEVSSEKEFVRLRGTDPHLLVGAGGG